MILVEKLHKLPPRCWMYNYNIKNLFGKTLKDYLIENKLPIPERWKDDGVTIFDKLIFNEIPDI